ncbi:MAG: NnrU family protein [Bradyrhizobiaceae bacterium]|nr:NnrU family protein [Bradyrhizobiaceae bacterium]
MGLVTMVFGLILFIGAHALVTLRPQRAAMVKAVGVAPYKILMSVVSLAGLYFVFRGFGMYRDAGPIPVWSPPYFMRHVTEALMLPACIFLAAAYLPGNIKRVLKHPMLVAVKTWAFAHLLINGDVGGIILFGSLLGWAVYDRITLKHRSDPGSPPIPLGGYRNDIAAVAVGIILYLALGMVFHPLVVGVIVFGTPAFGT